MTDLSRTVNCSNPRPLRELAVTVNGVPEMLKETARTLSAVSTTRTPASTIAGTIIAAKRRQLTRPGPACAVCPDPDMPLPPARYSAKCLLITADAPRHITPRDTYHTYGYPMSHRVSP